MITTARTIAAQAEVDAIYRWVSGMDDQEVARRMRDAYDRSKITTKDQRNA